MDQSYDGLKKRALLSDNLNRIAEEMFTPRCDKVRKKPRTPEKMELLRQLALAKNEKFKPSKTEEGVLKLPFFSNP
jgi:hypothetical protein